MYTGLPMEEFVKLLDKAINKEAFVGRYFLWLVEMHMQVCLELEPESLFLKDNLGHLFREILRMYRFNVSLCFLWPSCFYVPLLLRKLPVSGQPQEIRCLLVDHLCSKFGVVCL